MGVIDSLSAGYRFLSKRFELILIPVFLDIVLWQGPRLSLATLFEQAARIYKEAAVLPEMPEQMGLVAQQYANVLTEVGQNSNLLNTLYLISGTLLHVPSLLLAANPLPGAMIHDVADLIGALGLGGLFSIVGLGLGVTYVSLLARQLPIGASAKTWAWRELPGIVLRHSLQIIAFLVLGVILFLALLIPVTIVVTLVALIAPGLISVLAFLFAGLLMVLTIYLYFVPAALILDGLRLPAAMLQSFRLVRNNFWATLGIILLSELISAGFSLILRPLVVYQPAGTLTAIALNAYIGSGLVMGLFVFYRSRVLLAQGKQFDNGL